MNVLDARAVVWTVVSAVVCAMACEGTCSAGGTPVGTDFTYQGVLRQAGSPYTGSADFLFSLWEQSFGGVQIGGTQPVVGVPVTAGLFNATLNFGAVPFGGEERWLQIEVRAPSGLGSYTPLSPRRRLDATPYALYALNGANPSPFIIQGNDALFTSSGYLNINATNPAGGLRVTGDNGAVPIVAEYLSTVYSSPAIRGRNVARDGWGVGVHGEGSQIGVQGRANPGLTSSSSSTRIGVYGEAGVPNQNNVGVHGVVALVDGGGTRTGVFGGVSGGGTAGYGVRGFAPLGPNSWAGYFEGHGHFSGSLGIGTSSPQQTLSVNGGVNIDQGNANDATVVNSLRFGSNSGEAIASRRTAGTNQYGLDFYTNSMQRMTITNTGGVGIGTVSPGGFALAVNGFAANSTGTWSIFSDARLKTNIRDLPAGTLDRMLSLRGRNFEYTPEARAGNFGQQGVQTGFIAQEVRTVFPDWVAEGSDGHLFITERGTTALMVEALRELRAEKDRQLAQRDDRIADMQRRIDDLTALVNTLLNKEQKP